VRASSSRHAAIPSRATLPMSEWGIYVDPSVGRKPKTYAIAGGHIPGIYGAENYNEYKAIQQAQLTGFGGNKHQKVSGVSGAWVYLEGFKTIVDRALDQPRGRAYLALIGKSSTSINQSRQSAPRAQQNPVATVSQPSRSVGMAQRTPSSLPPSYAQPSRASPSDQSESSEDFVPPAVQLTVDLTAEQ
jgi:hypothetical protein